MHRPLGSKVDMNKSKSNWNNTYLRNLFLQFVLLLLIICLFYFLGRNLQINLKERGITSGFSFLEQRSGFNIIMHLIEYSEKSNYLRAFWVGVLNTLFVSAISVLIASVIGIIIGVARLSTNWLWSKIALVYIEIVRNVPLLIQLFFWYFVVLRAAPYPQNAINIWDIIFLTNRGLYVPKPFLSPISTILLILTIGLIIGYFLMNRVSLVTRFKKIIYFVIFILSLITVTQLSWQFPTFGRFNFENGVVLIPEFIALVMGLSIYTSVFIAEIVRMGILSIPRGQTEAAFSLGLSKKQTLRFIIMPQATKVIIPPLTSQYLNLTKNSSLAAAIGYPDLVSVFAGTVLNQSGQAVEVIGMTMLVYLFISLSISGVMILYERQHR